MKLENKNRWIIENWQKARELEIAMNETLDRYEDLFSEVHKKVKQAHPSLSQMNLHLRGTELENWGGNIIFSKKAWPSISETWRTGIYIWGIALDELSSEKSSGPSVYIYFHGKRNERRIEEFRSRIAAAAPRVFRSKKIAWQPEDEDDNRTLGWYQMPEDNKGLLKMLCDGNDQEFIDCIAKHIDCMCGFIPILDRLFT